MKKPVNKTINETINGNPTYNTKPAFNTDNKNSCPKNKARVNVGPSTFNVDVETQNAKVVLNGCTINFNFAITPSINQSVLTEMESLVGKLNVEDCFTASNEVNNYSDDFEDMYDDAPPCECDCCNDCECDNADGPEDPESQPMPSFKASCADLKAAADQLTAELDKGQSLEEILLSLVEKAKASMFNELESAKPDGVKSTIDSFKKAVEDMSKNGK